MKYYEVMISVFGDGQEEEVHQTFEVEAESFIEAVRKLESDLDVELM